MMISYVERYPTGRKHCSKCKRWRHILDFSVKKWEDYRREKPLIMHSFCRICKRIINRVKRGFKPRDVVNPYFPGSKDWQEFRNMRRRKRYRELAKDPKWKAQDLEYRRIYLDAKRAENALDKIHKT